MDKLMIIAEHTRAHPNILDKSWQGSGYAGRIFCCTGRVYKAVQRSKINITLFATATSIAFLYPSVPILSGVILSDPFPLGLHPIHLVDVYRPELTRDLQGL